MSVSMQPEPVHFPVQSPVMFTAAGEGTNVPEEVQPASQTEADRQERHDHSLLLASAASVHRGDCTRAARACQRRINSKLRLPKEAS